MIDQDQNHSRQQRQKGKGEENMKEENENEENENEKGEDSKINTRDGLAYWESVRADEDGMLGGVPSIEGGKFAFLSRVDLRGSRGFLVKLGIGNVVPFRVGNGDGGGGDDGRSTRGGMVKGGGDGGDGGGVGGGGEGEGGSGSGSGSGSGKGLRRCRRCLEGGAGIGRITQGLLADIADEIDIVEPIAKFTAALQGKPNVKNIFNCGLEEWRPVEGVRYDLVWTQWCVGHLTDKQLVSYLERCRDALAPDGVIVIKENLSTSGTDVFDDEDSSVTRQDEKFKTLFAQAGLKIVRMELQRGFPSTAAVTLLPVKMYALKPQT